MKTIEQVKQEAVAFMPFPHDAHLYYVVHATNSSGHPFVVHTYNCSDGGYHHGLYCETLKQALSIFAEMVDAAHNEDKRLVLRAGMSHI